MKDILHKISTLRTATARAIVKTSSEATIEAVKQQRVPKGHVLEFSRAAALLAIKKTSDVIPDCHPLPIEQAAVRYQLNGLCIEIEVEVSTIYKTGVEVEAMHGASVCALTIYDMLKPLDKDIEIQSIRLLKKTGGKSDYRDKLNETLKTALVICSDTVHAGTKEDRTGKSLMAWLEEQELPVHSYQILPDEQADIRHHVKQLLNDHYQLIILSGGTGLSPRDVTPEAIQDLIDKPIPGIMEAARAFGQQRTPYAMLSRGIAGMSGNTLILTLPGSSRGALESMQALFPAVKHIFRVLQQMRHED